MANPEVIRVIRPAFLFLGFFAHGPLDPEGKTAFRDDGSPVHPGGIFFFISLRQNLRNFRVGRTQVFLWLSLGIILWAGIVVIQNWAARRLR